MPILNVNRPTSIRNGNGTTAFAVLIDYNLFEYLRQKLLAGYMSTDVLLGVNHTLLVASHNNTINYLLAVMCEITMASNQLFQSTANL